MLYSYIHVHESVCRWNEVKILQNTLCVCKTLSLEAPPGSSSVGQRTRALTKTHQTQLSIAGLDPILQLFFQTVSCFYIPNVISWDCDQLRTHAHTHTHKHTYTCSDTHPHTRIQSLSAGVVSFLWRQTDNKVFSELSYLFILKYWPSLTDSDLWPLCFSLIVWAYLWHTCSNNKERLLHVRWL